MHNCETRLKGDRLAVSLWERECDTVRCSESINLRRTSGYLSFLLIKRSTVAQNFLFLRYRGIINVRLLGVPFLLALLYWFITSVSGIVYSYSFRGIFRLFGNKRATFVQDFYKYSPCSSTWNIILSLIMNVTAFPARFRHLFQTEVNNYICWTTHARTITELVNYFQTVWTFIVKIRTLSIHVK